MDLINHDAPFFLRPTKKVAQDLLGDYLEVQWPKSKRKVLTRIVETEAYLGLKDPACHTYQGKRSPRNESMYLSGGHSYVYFIYGMYHCFNIVTGGPDAPEAVLIRAVEPVEGEDIMRAQRNPKRPYDLCNGPGKLCLALGIDKKDDGKNLLHNKNIRVLTSKKKPKIKSGKSPRIGIGTDKEACFWPLRYFIKDNPWVSKMPSGNPR